MQTCPGFFLKSLLESTGKVEKSTGNLLEICSVKFVDTQYDSNPVCHMARYKCCLLT